MSKEDADEYTYYSDNSESVEESAEPKASANDAMTSNGAGSSNDSKKPEADFATRIADVQRKVHALHETEIQQKHVLLQVQKQYCARAQALETHQQALAKMTATLQNMHHANPVALPMYDETSAQGAKGQHRKKKRDCSNDGQMHRGRAERKRSNLRHKKKRCSSATVASCRSNCGSETRRMPKESGGRFKRAKSEPISGSEAVSDRSGSHSLPRGPYQDDSAVRARSRSYSKRKHARSRSYSKRTPVQTPMSIRSRNHSMSTARDSQCLCRVVRKNYPSNAS